MLENDRLDTSLKSNTSPYPYLAYLTNPISPNRLCGGNGLAAGSTTLSAAQVGFTVEILGLLDNLVTLSEDQLDVARVRHVRVDLEFKIS